MGLHGRVLQVSLLEPTLGTNLLETCQKGKAVVPYYGRPTMGQA